MAKLKLVSKRKEKRRTANRVHPRELPTTPWAYAVAMLAAMKEPVPQESNKQLPEDFSASDFDIIRARGLSSQI